MKPKVIPPKKHGISLERISPNAIKVAETLKSNGFDAYLVGGGIRDLLLELNPKDFDISTNARPEQILKLFRKARIIGRRFRIVHLYFGREIIEVTTYRGHHPDDDTEHPHALKSDTGQLLRDNIYGTVEEDALRRDFTVNSLYFDLGDRRLLDYAGGFSDIKARQIKTIGDPSLRFREDPVRMLRALRFAAKLGFEIDALTQSAIHAEAEHLSHVPAARLFDEFNKLLLAGCGESTFELLMEYGLFGQLFAQTQSFLNDTFVLRFITLALQNTDERIAQNKGITPAFLLAVLLWPALLHEMRNRQQRGEPAAVAFNDAAQKVITTQNRQISIPRRFSIPMREIWQLQDRLGKRNGKRADRTMGHPRFRAAYDFLLLREQCEDPSCLPEKGLGQWWTDYQTASPEQRKKMQQALGQTKPKRRRRKPRRT